MDHKAVSWSAVLIPATVAAVVTIGVTLLFQRTMWLQEQPGSVTLSFLLFLPFATSAVAAFAGDPKGSRGESYYISLPLFILAGALLVGAVLFHEGVVCMIMLSPLWLLAGMAGSITTYALRRRIREKGRLFCSALAVLPIMTSALEAQVSQPTEDYTVARSVIIDASTESVWRHVLSIPSVRETEGQWNFAQDVLGVPRPIGAVLEIEHGRITRHAEWQHGIRFDEQITAIRPLQAIQWNFVFPDLSVQNATDRHISPDGAHLKILTGEYALVPLSRGQTKVTLRTHYRLQSPLNAYASWWGEKLLGDIQSNVLAIVKRRSERT